MRKLLRLVSSILLVASTAGVISVASLSAEENSSSSSSSTTSSTSGKTYTVSKNGIALTVNESNLIFSLTANGHTYYSGQLDDTDTSLSSAKNQSFITSAITVGYIYNANSVTKRSLLDPSKKSRTKIEFNEEEAGFSADISMYDINLSLTLKAVIIDGGINISIPYSSIKETLEEDTSNRLSYISLYPAFGGSHGLVNNGYIFLPDGSGALVDLSKATSAHRIYSKNVYDDDIGISENRRSSTSSSPISLPMCAISDGEGAVIASIDEGAEFASLSASVKGIASDYNYSYFTYTYRDTYQKYVSLDDSKRVGSAQTDKNEFDISQDYLLLDNSNPSKMAISYRDYLSSKNMLPKANTNRGSLRVEWFMSENKKSLLGRETLKLTSTSYIETVAKELSSLDSNISFSYLGYTKGGLSYSSPGHLPTEGKTGGDDGHRNLNKSLKSLGISSSYSVDYVEAYSDDAPGEGELAKNIAEKYISSPDVHSSSSLTYLSLKPSSSASHLKSEENGFINLGGEALNFTHIGNLLFSDWSSPLSSRKKSKETYTSAMNSLTLKANMVKPNEYMWPYLNSYLEAPLSSSNYLIETSSFPFLSFVLGGTSSMYSSPINLNYYGAEELLRLIDYGVAPCFLLTEEDPINLYGTSSEYLFTSLYSSWSSTLKEWLSAWKKVYATLGNSPLANRESDGNVVINTYENGDKLYLNYSSDPITYNGIELASYGAEVSL